MRNLACFQTHVLTVHRRCAAGLLVVSLSVEWLTRGVRLLQLDAEFASATRVAL